jgi:hypothetical protein
MRSHNAASEGHATEDPASDAFPGGVSGPFQMTPAGELDAPAMARAAVGGWTAGRVGDATLADAQLLVGNSLRHADTPDGATVVAALAASSDGAAEQRRAATLSAQARAGRAGRRARAARRAAERAATEHARRADYPVADLHAAAARHHEDVARRLRLSGGDGRPDAA